VNSLSPGPVAALWCRAFADPLKGFRHDQPTRPRALAPHRPSRAGPGAPVGMDGVAAEELELFNAHIVGLIEVVHEFP
jgi:hypothetical protein